MRVLHCISHEGAALLALVDGVDGDQPGRQSGVKYSQALLSDFKKPPKGHHQKVTSFCQKVTETKESEML